MSVKFKIKDYKQIVAFNLGVLDQLKVHCQNDCINHETDDDYKKALQDIIKTKNVNEWNEICRGSVRICQEYYNMFHSTENLVAELNDLVNQMEASLKSAQIKRIYIHDNPRNYVIKTKIDEMTVNQFKEKLNQKINACSGKSQIRNCEMSKIQIYGHVISQLNHEVQMLWDNFMKKNGLKSKIVNIQSSNSNVDIMESLTVPASVPMPSVTNVRMNDYEKVSEWIESLHHLRGLCKTECLDDINMHEHEDTYAQMEHMIKTKPDEAWNAVCRHRPNSKMCEQYYKTFHQTRALILKLNQLCKQINVNTNAFLKDRMQLSMGEFASVQEQKISAMTLSDFEKKINQKINACLNRVYIRRCELSKIQIYIDYINKLNVKVSSQWDGFMKDITPDPKRMSNVKESEIMYNVNGDVIRLNVNPITGDVIEVHNIQAAGKTKKQFKKTRNALNKHNKKHSIRRHPRRHSKKSRH